MSRGEEEKVEEEEKEKEKQKRATIASAPDDFEQNLPIFLAALLRKAATDRREKASIARSRKGELNAQKKAAAEEALGVSYLKFAARATEMTRTQKRINRGGY